MKILSLDNLPKYSDGISMIEVLVAMAILVVGLLGAAGMQVSSMRSHQDGYERTIALHQVSDMADRMRANKQAAIQGAYAIANPVDPVCFNAPAGCTAQQMAQFDVFSWNADNLRLLTGGNGAVTAVLGANGVFLITVNWIGRNGLETVAVSVMP